MEIKLDNGAVVIKLSDDDLVSWSHDSVAGIYTMNMVDGSIWKYNSNTCTFYKLR